MRAPHVGVAKDILKEKDIKFEKIFNILTNIEYGIAILEDVIEEDQKKFLINMIEEAKLELKSM